MVRKCRASSKGCCRDPKRRAHGTRCLYVSLLWCLAKSDAHTLSLSALRRLEQFTLSRKEWCISRQRAWGVPIPALYDVETGEALLTDASVDHIIKIFDERGTDSWWNEPDDTVFVAPEYRDNGKVYKRGYDTMDVWFDSGTSWTMIDERDPKKPVADVYLEGSDQHRGWFQSSLLTSSE